MAPLKVLFFTRGKQLKKLFFYLRFYYYFNAKIINSDFGDFRIVKFKSLHNFESFLHWINQLQIRKFSKVNNSQKIKLVGQGQEYKLFEELETEEAKILPKKRGSIFLEKKKHTKTGVKKIGGKVDLCPLYVILEKNLLTYKFFRATFLGVNSVPLLQLIYYILCYNRKLFFQIYCITRYFLLLYLYYFNGNNKANSTVF